jgi:hypothetical protein
MPREMEKTRGRARKREHIGYSVSASLPGAYVSPMRTEARPRHQISEVKLRWLRPILRYSYTRQAYVLKGVGRHIGRVYERTIR